MFLFQINTISAFPRAYMDLNFIKCQINYSFFHPFQIMLIIFHFFSPIFLDGFRGKFQMEQKIKWSAISDNQRSVISDQWSVIISDQWSLYFLLHLKLSPDAIQDNTAVKLLVLEPMKHPCVLCIHFEENFLLLALISEKKLVEPNTENKF